MPKNAQFLQKKQYTMRLRVCVHVCVTCQLVLCVCVNGGCMFTNQLNQFVGFFDETQTLFSFFRPIIFQSYMLIKTQKDL